MIALFDRCFYFQIDKTFVCMGNADFGDGPLNVVTSAPPSTHWRACGLRTGDRVRLQNHRLHIGPHVRFDIESLQLWQPTPVLPPVDIDTFLTALERFHYLREPNEGLASAAFLTNKNLSNQYVKGINNFSVWLENQFERTQPLEWDDGLLGAGPGLTPSGDDFLGTAVLTLQAIGESEIAVKLFSNIEGKLTSHTNPISAQHLIAASQGWAGSALHEVFSAASNQSHAGLLPALNKLAETGHTSGWDALAGLYTTLKIWHPCGRSRRDAA